MHRSGFVGVTVGEVSRLWLHFFQGLGLSSLLARKRSIFDAIQKNLKLCCNHDGQAVLKNRNATMESEGGCRNGVSLKQKFDSM
jgi:hypothetical protein